jgi:hypothetical protein
MRMRLRIEQQGSLQKRRWATKEVACGGVMPWFETNTEQQGIRRKVELDVWMNES